MAMHSRRGVMLAAVLVIVVLLAMLGLSFGFSMRADLLSTAASGDELQARLAAEAGIQRVIQLLQVERMYVSSWLDNPEQLSDVLMWSQQQAQGPAGFGRRTEQPRAGQEGEPQGPAWRFSIVADDPAEDEQRVRFGIVPESAKLNINTASAAQLTTLFDEVLDSTEVAVPELVDALLDWRDADDDPRPNGAESEYYEQLRPAGYVAKNGPFETVEELLLVRGFTGKVLFGEDYNRNGLLDANENDAEASFPPDNSDSRLDRGLLPYLTVWSRELNTASDGRPRVCIAGGIPARLRAQLEEFFDPAVVTYLTQAGLSGGNPLRSPVELVTREGSPLTLDDLPAILDRVTTLPLPGFMGLINVNAAPAEVLRTIPELQPYVDDIVGARASLSDEQKRTPAWLCTAAGVPLDVLAQVVGARPDYGITTGAYQFSVESVGYADHVGAFKRLQVVLEMIWPSNPQVLYFRDLTPLGLAYRVHELTDNVFASRTR